MNPQPLSDRAADIMFGPPPATNDFDSDLYQMHRMVDRLLEEQPGGGFDELVARLNWALVAAQTFPPVPATPDFGWDLPCPQWPGNHREEQP